MIGYKYQKSYSQIEARISELEDELEEIRKEYFAMEDEDEADELYGEQIDDLRHEIEELNGELYERDIADLTRDYYRSLL